jgi:Cu/Ag efflux protein CusF
VKRENLFNGSIGKSTARIALIAGLAFGLTSPAAAEWASGEIRRVDPDNLRLTIKHGDIKSLDMPPMTMVFYVNDKALISGLNAQDKIQFKATAEGKKYFVTEIRKAP